MKTDIEVIRALVELGDKATPYALFSIGHSVCYDGRYVGEDGEECGDAIRVAEADSGVAEFLCAAANACPALRAMLARLEKLEKVAKAAEKAQSSLEAHADEYNYWDDYNALDAALKDARDA